MLWQKSLASEVSAIKKEKESGRHRKGTQSSNCRRTISIHPGICQNSGGTGKPSICSSSGVLFDQPEAQPRKVRPLYQERKFFAVREKHASILVKTPGKTKKRDKLLLQPTWENTEYSFQQKEACHAKLRATDRGDLPHLVLMIVRIIGPRGGDNHDLLPHLPVHLTGVMMVLTHLPKGPRNKRSTFWHLRMDQNGKSKRSKGRLWATELKEEGLGLSPQVI